MAKISVIVPAYNAGKYIHQCLGSVIEQSFQDFELWVINDGSTDKTQEVAEKYALLDNRIKVINKDNQGVSASRNIGLEHSNGEYVCFIDADDIVEPSYLSELAEKIDSQHDSSVCGFAHFGDTEGQNWIEIPQKKSITLEESLMDFYDLSKKERQRYLWNRMFKRSFIEKFHLRFNEDIHYKEDGLFLVQYLCASGQKVACVDKVLYHYRINPEGAIGSLEKRFNPKQLTNIIAHKLILKELRKYSLSQEVMNSAIHTAEISCCWVLATMHRTHYKRFRTRLWIEWQMLQSLGLAEYLRWRCEGLFFHFSNQKA